MSKKMKKWICYLMLISMLLASCGKINKGYDSLEKGLIGILENREEKYFITENQIEVKVPLNLSFCKAADISFDSNKTIFVDADKLQYPLILRHWNKGDSFQPFGMNGKSKKVSKLFKDEKLSLVEKENSWLLCSNDEIVWIIGLRQDERFRIENTTTNRLKIQLEE